MQYHGYRSGPGNAGRIAVHPYFAGRHCNIIGLFQAVGHLDDGLVCRYRSDDDFTTGHRETIFIAFHYFKAAAIIFECDVERTHAGIPVRGGLGHTVDFTESQF
ncbi:hypothetical protein SDC9_168810 [bioreactor metagenome]|uniref:Uncharacterized protein n=1 Tax=bioreactor metagenome TaxID=1076179 RepID=A0A645G3I7_9ZZZZ